ncbi:ATP synthase F0 sector subunit b [hydrothermal vent metagenome]|uniref:ATP synthase F0 sector subunit b n=1 Tax=hydrothermal vent metagenome TaxID=652676 RepID=A0A3B1B1R6_9ZZZZ
MAKSKIILDKKLLRTLDPMHEMGFDKLDELVNKSQIEELPAGYMLFKQGERDKRTRFLLAGQVELSSIGDNKARLIRAKSHDAKKPLADEIPRSHTCRTKTEATILTIDSDLLEILVDENPSGLYEVDELDSDDSSYWMMRFLQSRAFLNLPTENIQALLMALEEMPVEKNQIIISQGKNDNYYYIVQKGKCSVSRRPAPRAAEMQLAILSEGDGFGEEALITNGMRNASITMLESGTLMRLKKEDFLQHLANPLIEYTDEKDVLAEVSKGSLLIDVRSNDEYQANRVEGSVNIPLSMLRLKLEGMNDSRNYILCCADGTRSAAAAFLLTQHGLTCHVLRGGLDKANIKLPEANLSVSVAPKVETQKTQAADRNFKAAEEKAEKLKQQAEKARDEAREIAQRVEKAEATRRKAAKEVERQQKEEINQRDAAIRSAKMRIESQANQAREAEEKAARLKLEAKAVSLKAEEELQRIRKEAESVKKRQQSLNNSLKRAEQITTEANKAAQEARLQAEKEANKIRQEAELEAQQLREEMEATTKKILTETKAARKKEEAERQAMMATVRLKEKEADEIRKQAKLEAQKMRKKMQTEHSLLLEQAEKDRQEKNAERQTAIELARRKASEAEEIRRQAELDAQKIRTSLSEHEASLLAARENSDRERQRMLEEAQQQAQKVIEETSRKADAEAEAIRRRAEEEAIKLQHELEEARQDLEASRNNIAKTEALQRETMLEESRKQAEELIKQSTQHAEAEAETIRKHAEEEAQQLRRELEDTRQQLESSRSSFAETGRIQGETLLDESRRQARDLIKQSTQDAETDAEKIRQQARAEAEQLRAELARARTQIQETISQAKNSGTEERDTIIGDAEKHARELMLEANRKAEEEATRIRVTAEQEAQRVRDELEQSRQQLAEQAKNIKKVQAINSRFEKEKLQKEQLAKKQQLAKRSQKKQVQARLMAEQIKARLEQAEQQRQNNEQQNNNNGMSLAEVTLKRVGDRIILEGTNDIFIFKEPSAAPVEDAIPELQAAVNRDDDGLPSFTVDSQDAPTAEPFNSQEFEQAMRERDEVLNQANKNKRKGLFTAAASLIFTVAIAVGVLFYNPDLQQELQLSESTPAPELKAKASINPVSALKQTLDIPSKLAIANEESRLLKEAEASFDMLVDKWNTLVTSATSASSVEEESVPVIDLPFIEDEPLPAAPAQNTPTEEAVTENGDEDALP